MTVTESTERAPAATSGATARETGDEPEWLESVISRVQRRHPGAPPWLVERSVQDAARRFDDAGIHLYLPILVERRGAMTVAAVLTADEASSTHPEVRT